MKRKPTDEQKAAAEARRESFRALSRQIAAMSPEQRAALRGPDAVSFAQSIGLYNPALVEGYARLLEREIARLERLADLSTLST